MGQEMSKRGWAPDLAVVSPALRTQQTFERVAAELPTSARLELVPKLYEASAGELLSQITKTPRDVRTLLLVAHNPGTHELARLLAGPGSDEEAGRAINLKFPTAALAVFEIRRTWNTIGAERPRLTAFLRPKKLIHV